VDGTHLYFSEPHTPQGQTWILGTIGYQQRHSPQARFYIGKTLRPSTPGGAARLFRKAQEMGSDHHATS